MSALIALLWRATLAVAAFVAATFVAAAVIVFGLHAAPAWIAEFGNILTHNPGSLVPGFSFNWPPSPGAPPFSAPGFRGEWAFATWPGGVWVALGAGQTFLAVAATLIVSTFIGAFAFLPAAAAILIAEVFSLRSLIYFAAVGAAIGALARAAGFDPVPLPQGLDVEALGLAADLVRAGLMTRADSIVLGAGAAGGLVYWLIAGRQAGSWRRQPPAAAFSTAESAPPTAAEPTAAEPRPVEPTDPAR